MSGTRNVAVLLGSLQKRSCNRRIADELAEIAPRTLRLEIVDISRLSLYTQNLDAAPPLEWVLFRQQILAADGLLFMTTENSRTVPGILKNALEIGARPCNRNAWAGKPCGIVSISPDGIARGRTDRHLRRALLLQDVPVMEQPDARIRHGTLLFDSTGRLVNVEIRCFLQQFVAAFQNWVDSGHLH